MIKMIRILLVTLVLFLSGNAQADLEGKLNDYYNSLGGAASVSPSGMYKTQSAGYFSGGGIRIRTPVSNYQLLSFQAPKLQYGCGGIDAFLGGFSFINKEQLIAMARQIGSTAVSTAFYLALDSMSPQLSALMKQLQEWANKANQFNINSCEVGTQMGAAMWRGMGGDKQKFCERANTGKGVLADEFTSRMVCNGDGWDFSWVPGSSDPNTDDELKLKRMAAGNIVWRALKSAGINDNELAELIMSVTGTIVIPDGNSKEPQKAKPVEATMTYNDVLEGAQNFRMVKCDEYIECKNPSTVNFSSSSKMVKIRKRVEGGINHIINAVTDLSGVTDIALCPASTCPTTGDALTVIELSEYPIFSLIQAAHDAGAGGEMIAGDYKELLIKEITYRFFVKAVTPLSTALANDGEAIAGTESMRQALGDHLRSVMGQAQADFNAEQAKVGGLAAIMEVYMKMKQMATSRYSPSLTQRLRMAQILRR
jgi:hypothetical protein